MSDKGERSFGRHLHTAGNVEHKILISRQTRRTHVDAVHRLRLNLIFEVRVDTEHVIFDNLIIDGRIVHIGLHAERARTTGLRDTVRSSQFGLRGALAFNGGHRNAKAAHRTNRESTRIDPKGIV